MDEFKQRIANEFVGLIEAKAAQENLLPFVWGERVKVFDFDDAVVYGKGRLGIHGWIDTLYDRRCHTSIDWEYKNDDFVGVEIDKFAGVVEYLANKRLDEIRDACG